MYLRNSIIPVTKMIYKEAGLYLRFFINNGGLRFFVCQVIVASAGSRLMKLHHQNTLFMKANYNHHELSLLKSRFALKPKNPV